MYKQLFGLLLRLITSPAKAWNELSEKQENDNEIFFKSYFYPLLGIIALFSFVGIFFTQKNFDVQLALKTTIKMLIAVYGGFYLTFYLLDLSMQKFFGRGKNHPLCQRFVGYSSALVYALYLILAFFPEFFFLNVFLLYTIYIVWEGATPYMDIEENNKLKFTFIASIIVIFCPHIIEYITFLLMPGLRT